MNQYSFSVANAVCKDHGLVFRQDLANIADDAFLHQRFTQKQAEAMQVLWIRLMCAGHDRSTYSLRQRITMALYWLGFGRSLKSW